MNNPVFSRWRIVQFLPVNRFIFGYPQYNTKSGSGQRKRQKERRKVTFVMWGNDSVHYRMESGQFIIWVSAVGKEQRSIKQGGDIYGWNRAFSGKWNHTDIKSCKKIRFFCCPGSFESECSGRGNFRTSGTKRRRKVNHHEYCYRIYRC